MSAANCANCEPAVVQVLFSSVTSLLGAAGQHNYSAANAVLDAIAAAGKRQGQAVVSVQWGAWAGSGMAAKADAGIAHRLERMGMALLTTQQGLAVLKAVMGVQPLTHVQATIACVPISWKLLLAQQHPVLDLFKECATTTIPQTQLAGEHTCMWAHA